MQNHIRAIFEQRAKIRDRLHGKGAGRDLADHLGDRFVMADRFAPLDALLGPSPNHRQTPLPGRGAAGGDGHAAGVERRERDLEPPPDAADHVQPVVLGTRLRAP